MRFQFKLRGNRRNFEVLTDLLYIWRVKEDTCFKYGCAAIHYDGSMFYIVNGEYHREDGPAVIWANGIQAYYLNGKYHREDGPAVIWPNGSQEYYLNGELHREDGPAVIYSNGYQEYCLNGKHLTKKAWEKKINAI